ncbi:MAG TPA: SRPBCC family protein [Dermatophilaceae bacterium]|nr:SRPBCC family protein [Dermatophilaceae bacterium]
MAHFRTTLSSTAPVTVAFDHLADFASVADWDPGISEAHLTSGAPGQVGARYAVASQFGPRRIPLEYQIVTREDPHEDQPGRVVLVADGGSFTSHDTITVRPGPLGAEVTYDAVLTLRGLGRIMDIPLHLAFQVIGRRAETGLRQELARLGAAADPQP